MFFRDILEIILDERLIVSIMFFNNLNKNCNMSKIILELG